jgi:hypothetical protein
MNKIKQWLKDKWCQLVTAFGALGSLLWGYVQQIPGDISPWMAHLVTLTSAKWGAAIALAAAFLASNLRHRKAAATVTDLKNQLANPPPPLP